jgi:hypothetical protein
MQTKTIIGAAPEDAPASATAQALVGEEAGKLAPLPEKLPASVEARVGKIEFANGLPTKTGIQQIFDVQDFQRGCQLYQWAIPLVGSMGWHRANIANGATNETDWVAYDAWAPRSGILTPNQEVTYVMAFPDLEKTGPLVLEYPAGKIAGIVMDYWQRPQADYGLTGSERGQSGGKILIVGPGQEVPQDTTGYHVVLVSTRFLNTGYRVLDRSAKEEMSAQVRLYPYSQRETLPAVKVIFATKAFTQSQPRGFAYWESVNEIVQREPVQERDRLFAAMLRALGIEKGKPFQPDSRMKDILTDAVAMGEQMARVTVYEKRFENAYYRKDAKWQYALVVDPSQRQPNYDELDERTDWFYEAFGASYAMITKTPGVGSIYLATYQDKDGDWLDGSKNYSLHVSPNPPMKQFWAASVYDMDTRNLMGNESAKAEISSNTQGLQKNADGSVDVYFGPKPPAGKESNWVETQAGIFWFPYFRLYAPTEAYFDQSWPLPDIELVQ